MSTPDQSHVQKPKRPYITCLLWVVGLTALTLAVPFCYCFLIPTIQGFLYEMSHCSPSVRGALQDSHYRIAFASDRDGNNEIYIMNADGSDRTNLTQNLADDRYPVVSPDGKRIAFASNRTGNYQVYVMNTDGGGVTNLLGNKAQEGGEPVDFDSELYRKPLMWTDNGTRLIFGASDNQFYIMNADGTNRQRLRSFQEVFPEPSPNGRYVAFIQDSQIPEIAAHGGNNVLVVTNADGTNRRELTASDVFGFNWSPDSSQIAYWRGQVYVTDLDNLTSHAVFERGFNAAGSINWSKDGRYLAFDHYPNRGRDSREEGLEHREIYVGAADGSSWCLLTLSLRYDDNDPSWIP
jgi:Tol biopolymer transport system component